MAIWTCQCMYDVGLHSERLHYSLPRNTSFHFTGSSISQGVGSSGTLCALPLQYTHTHTHARTHARTHAHTHTHTHTHTPEICVNLAQGIEPHTSKVLRI